MRRRSAWSCRLARAAAMLAGTGVLLTCAVPGAVAAPAAVAAQAAVAAGPAGTAASARPANARAAVAALATTVGAGAVRRDGDTEGGTRTMRERLEGATKGYLDAQVTLENSVKRQAGLVARQAALRAELTAGTAALGEMAASAYRTGRLGPITALLNADTPGGLLDGAALLRSVAADQDRTLATVVQAQRQVDRSTAAVRVEIRQQRRQVGLMAARKRQAEQALKEFGGRVSNGFRGTRPLLARPAPRTAGGRLVNQSCSIDDPTTGGCITPRTLHALRQSRAAGFSRFVSCFRGGGPGEHPKGRACDYAVHKGRGFGGVATGGARAYGDDLAAYLVRNARRLGVLYVIWYRQIWFPGGGWRHYTLGRGDPSSNHTNHVHLSLY